MYKLINHHFLQFSQFGGYNCNTNRIVGSVPRNTYHIVWITNWFTFSIYRLSLSKIEVPRDVRNSKGPQTWQAQERTVPTLEQTQVPNGTGPGVRRSKRPLPASRTRCNAPWKPPKFGKKVKIGNKVQFGNKFANCCNVWSIEGVIVYGHHVPECHVTSGRGRLHNFLWDPHIDHKTSWGTISNVPWRIPVRGA